MISKPGRAGITNTEAEQIIKADCFASQLNSTQIKLESDPQ
jgi:hypothetical protein